MGENITIFMQMRRLSEKNILEWTSWSTETKQTLRMKHKWAHAVRDMSLCGQWTVVHKLEFTLELAAQSLSVYWYNSEMNFHSKRSFTALKGVLAS